MESPKLYRTHWKCWRLLGHHAPQSFRIPYYIYSFVFNTVGTVGFPLHLMIGAFASETKSDMFKNLVIGLPCVVCSLKALIIWWRLDKMHTTLAIVRKLDRRVTGQDEISYYKAEVVPAVMKVVYLFYFICFSTAVSSEIAVLAAGFLYKWQLMYPAYFPFDPYATTFNYVAAHIYQLAGVSFEILQNFNNDTIGAMSLALLAGHVRMLGMRIARIGYDSDKTIDENKHELELCIEDHKNILKLFAEIRSLISMYMFFQFIFCAVNICVSVIFLIYYVDDVLSYIYYTCYLFAMPMEIYPVCYYGTVFEMELEKLTYAMFECKWIDQSKDFKRNLRIFIEQSLRKTKIMAAGIFQINLDTFFGVCKMTYSLFAVIIRMK